MAFKNISNIAKTKIDVYSDFQSIIYKIKFFDSSLVKYIDAV